MARIIAKVGANAFTINVPVITNPDKATLVGSEIVVRKYGWVGDEALATTPAAKQRCSTADSPANKEGKSNRRGAETLGSP